MMPWEHAAMGYVAFSLFVHAVYRDSPTARETIVVVFASILPDLIDKPLAWEFGILEGGRTLGHSIFVATPLSVAILALAYRGGRPKLGWAFAIGYMLHLPADVFQSYMTGGELSFHYILWPINGGGAGQGGFTDTFLENFAEYAVFLGGELTSGDPNPYALLLVGMGVFTVLLWVYDGMPVAREGYVAGRRLLRSVADDARSE